MAEAKAQLSQLIDAALDGEEIVIARRNTPLVMLAVLKRPNVGLRFGMFAGRIRLSSDFDEPLDDFAAYAPPRPARGRKR